MSAKEELILTRNAQAYEEPLIFERSRSGRQACSLPDDDSELPMELEKGFLRNDLRLPEVSEVEAVRHFTRLSTWNYGIDLNLYPLGSCTMKYNPRINEEIAALAEYTDRHPDLPENHAQNFIKIIYELQECLKALTDMPGVTLQPAAGAHGELCGMFLVSKYFKTKGEKRPIVLIPDSAHGTNPATCTLAGFETKAIASTPEGLVDLEWLKANLDSNTAALMITNPNTLGIFEKNIEAIAEILHKNGSLLYMDGANYNAVVGAASLSRMGVDISHLNLHKTFSTPHGGGGPGAAAVVVSERVKEFLPGPIAIRREDGSYGWSTPSASIGRMKAGPGQSGVLLRALAYVLTWGDQIHQIAENSILNANIVRKRLEGRFAIASPLDSMHEAVFSDAKFKKTGLDTLSLAKSLIDYGYHPPTVYFPLNVSGAMMIEPTETESPETLEHFCRVMLDLADRMEAQDESMKATPRRAFVKRIDEVSAARQPVLNYFTKKSAEG